MSRRVTFLPAGPVCFVTSVLPRISVAYFFTSSMFLASLTPPALPRPPAWICALTTTAGEPISFGFLQLHQRWGPAVRLVRLHRRISGLPYFDTHECSWSWLAIWYESLGILSFVLVCSRSTSTLYTVFGFLSTIFDWYYYCHKLSQIRQNQANIGPFSRNK